MSRARARELVLVNWKGVFFERYLLDPNVTALEGDNGAGKTTVMVAAYVTLLPDLSRLRFTNLGETGATGGDKGIWGRLGNPARPSFSALTLELGDGTTVIAGVHLKRKAEPSLELEPFLITGLQRDARARDFLLLSSGTHDEIPTLDGVKQLVAAHAATLEVFATNKAYFAALFALGAGPMRLSTDEELNKYNDMLRTSMTGGISRALTSELRSFVFKQELGLSDTLGRMRTSLNACRKTRTEVAESRELQRHITGVFSAGSDMFETAMAAARRAAVEQGAAGTRAQKSLSQAEARLESQNHELADALARQELVAARLKGLERSSNEARDEVARCQRALDAVNRIAKLEAELTAADQSLTEQRAQQERAASDRQRDKEQRDQHQAGVTKSAQGLANLQSGLDELHRRAHAYRHAHSELSRAQAAFVALGWEAPEVDPNTSGENATPEGVAAEAPRARLSRALERARVALAECDQERAKRQRDSEAAEVLRRDYEAARLALETLIQPLPPGNLVEAARSVLSEAREREQKAARRGEFERELQTLRAAQKRQEHVRQKAALAGLPAENLDAQAVHQALYDLDASCRDQRERSQRSSWSVREALESIERVQAKRHQLEELEGRFRQLSEARARLATVAVQPGSDDDALALARAEVLNRIHRAQERIIQLTRERDNALSEAAALVEHSDAAPLELLELRDLVEGALFASRFEELEPELARHVEARLGPLRHAIVVEDVGRARALLSGVERQIADVYLVPAGTDPCPLPETPSEAERDIAVETQGVLRITRIPEVATLGRVARERRARELRRAAEERERALEDEAHAERELWSALQDLELFRGSQLWHERDLPEEQAELARSLAAATERAERSQREAEAASREAENARLRAAAIRPLLSEAALLDEPALDARIEACQLALETAESAAQELEATAAARTKLSRMLEALQSDPPSPATIALWKEESDGLAGRRDQLFTAVEALEQVSRQEHALHYRDAERALDDRKELVPELEAQHRELTLVVQAAEEHVRDSERRWEAETAKLQSLSAARAAIAAHLERVIQDLAREGIQQPSEQALADALLAQQQKASEFDAANQETRELSARVALARERHSAADRERQAAQADLERARGQATPAEAAWHAARERATSHDLRWSASLDSDEPDQHSRELWLQAQGKRLLLLDRLAAASGGTLVEGFEVLDPGMDPLGYVDLWRRVREWLHKRLPVQVADVADPVLALERLRDDLCTLEGRLHRQEDELKGASGDVARSIEVQVRRATSQIRRINQYLSGICFGSIHGIRIQMDRVEAMTPILEAMRNGNAQRLLFQTNLPFEEALDEIFKRYGGGRGGGHRILDYREYIDLKVEVKRQVDASNWELANPTRVSTGEAIGVGAALMMVILTEWERDATLLRTGKAYGSLRFLFLDEANRLSQDNLGVLFDLCQNLELQLLIAAPEVARAEGNTTYRLVRRLTEDGGEEVLVTGRRSQLPGRDTANPEPAPSNGAVDSHEPNTQQALFE